jgi:hypothetical protein
MTCVWVKDILDCPWQSPEDVPLLVFLALHPTSLLKVLHQYRLIEVGFVFESKRVIVYIWLHFYIITAKNKKLIQK